MADEDKKDEDESKELGPEGTTTAPVEEKPKDKEKPKTASRRSTQPSGLKPPKKGQFVVKVKGQQVGDPHDNRNLAIRAGQQLVQARRAKQADVSVEQA